MNIVILDRDGVINHDSDQYIKSAEEWRPIDGSLAAIAALNQAGLRVFIATNQSGLARDLFSTADLHAMHDKMNSLLAEKNGCIERVFFCPHHPDAHCDCRKPATGLLDQLEEYLGFSVAGAYLVGDSRKDLELALAKDCRPLLVRTGKGEQTARKLPAAGIKVFPRLAEAADYIVQQQAATA